jgi:hypothetical protein
MNLRDAARRYLAIDENRLVALTETEAIPLASIRRGIVFIWATWSGAAQLALRTLNQALATVGELHDLQLYIANSDSDMTHQFFLDIGDRPSGMGETYWVIDGRIQNKLAGYGPRDLPIIEAYIRQVLSA